MRGVTITFNGTSVHTGNDLDLVQEEKTIGAPEVQTYKIDVPGRNGSVNLTKALTGKVCYNNREIRLVYCGTGSRSQLQDLRDAVNRYHGEVIRIIDDDTPNYYYEGEAIVETQLYPNRIAIEITVDANPFMFGNTDKYISVNLSTVPQNLTINNPGVEIIPTFKVFNTAKIVKGSYTGDFSAGTFALPQLELSKGSNNYVVSGIGVLAINYKEAKI